MNITEENNIILENQLNSCRCCQRTLIDHQKSIEISENVRNNFYELTGLIVSNKTNL